MVNDVRAALTSGPGYIVLKNVFDEETIVKALARVISLADSSEWLTYIQDQGLNQKRILRLLHDDPVFIKLATADQILETVELVLGSNYILGSFFANHLLPGAHGQEPHIDYPYFYLAHHNMFPTSVGNGQTVLNCQVNIMLTDFTELNGATACVPGSQTLCAYPNPERFESEKVYITGAPGDVIVFNALLWHCASKNRSSNYRTAVFAQYLPSFMVPMEDLRSKFQGEDNLNPKFKKLLGLSLPFPARYK